jgi:thiol:disulfide interchange protein
MNKTSIIWTASYALVIGSVLLAFAGLLVFSDSRRQDAVLIDLHWKSVVVFIIALALSLIARIPEKKKAMDIPSGFKHF